MIFMMTTWIIAMFEVLSMFMVGSIMVVVGMGMVVMTVTFTVMLITVVS